MLPFKLYMYLASGKAIISQSSLSTPQGVPSPPIESVSEPLAKDLADAILRLAADPDRRDRMAREVAAYYRRWLANSCVMRDRRNFLDGHIGSAANDE